jgi:DNA adenine methylase
MIVGDIIPELIDLWKLIKDDFEGVLLAYLEDYNIKLNKGIPYYYEVRDRFNKQKSPLDFMFLLRNSVNGLVRYKGEFNASAHLNGRKGITPENLERILLNWQPILSNVRFICADYSHLLLFADADSFVFMDPPYLDTKSSMHRLTDGKSFDHERLYHTIDRLPCRWMLTFDNR